MSCSLIINSKNRVAPAATPNDATYYFDWSRLEEGKYKVTWNIYRAPPVVALTPFQLLLASKAPWGRYSADAWVAGTNSLTDLTGNGRHATTAGVTSGSAAGFGATASIPYLAGTITNTILWPAGSIPAAYSICAITRYTNGAANQERTLTSRTNNWLQGHHANKRGVAFNNTAWRTATASTGVLLNWLNCCATSDGTAPNNVLVDGTGVGLAVNGGGVAMPLCINLRPGGEFSDFQFSQLIIWDQALTDSELATVSAALTNYLATGVLQ